MSQDTVGKVAIDLQQKLPDSRDPIEIQREIQKDYIKHLQECVQSSRKNIIGNFFVEVQCKREKLLKNVLRNYFIARSSCPTPNYDQTVFFYNNTDETIEYLWTVPDRDTCLMYLENAMHIDPSEKDLLKCIMDYADGTLLRTAKKLNGEKEDSPLLVN